MDVLYNNAGIMIDEGGLRPGYVFDTDLKTVRKTLETNTLAPLRLCQVLIPLMRKNGYGRIINISSIMGQLEDMGGEAPAYRISKTALNAVTKLLAVETEDENILVNSAHPGWVKTEMGGKDAQISVDDAVPDLVYLATLPDKGPSGKFFFRKKEIAW